MGEWVAIYADGRNRCWGSMVVHLRIVRRARVYTQCAPRVAHIATGLVLMLRRTPVSSCDCTELLKSVTHCAGNWIAI